MEKKYLQSCLKVEKIAEWISLTVVLLFFQLWAWKNVNSYLIDSGHFYIELCFSDHFLPIACKMQITSIFLIIRKSS